MVYMVVDYPIIIIKLIWAHSSFPPNHKLVDSFFDILQILNFKIIIVGHKKICVVSFLIAVKTCCNYYEEPCIQFVSF